MALFVVLKGYHMGSKWFEEAFSSVSLRGFQFEFEHCLRHSLPREAIRYSANFTLQFLRTSCGCENRKSCSWCSQPPATLVNSSKSLIKRQPELQPTPASQCVASGVSFAVISSEYIEHITSLLAMEPAISVVLHVRSNIVKQAVSMLRVHCEGQVNHLSASWANSYTRASMHIRPAVLIQKVFAVAKEQSRRIAMCASPVPLSTFLKCAHESGP